MCKQEHGDVEIVGHFHWIVVRQDIAFLLSHTGMGKHKVTRLLCHHRFCAKLNTKCRHLGNRQIPVFDLVQPLSRERHNGRTGLGLDCACGGDWKRARCPRHSYCCCRRRVHATGADQRSARASPRRHCLSRQEYDSLFSSDDVHRGECGVVGGPLFHQPLSAVNHSETKARFHAASFLPC